MGRRIGQRRSVLPCRRPGRLPGARRACRPGRRPRFADFVVVRPPEGLATAAVYGCAGRPSEPQTAWPLIEALRQGDWRQVGRRLLNRLQPAAETLSPWVKRLQQEFSRLDFLGHGMSGSGTSYFGLCRHARHARRVRDV